MSLPFFLIGWGMNLPGRMNCGGANQICELPHALLLTLIYALWVSPYIEYEGAGNDQVGLGISRPLKGFLVVLKKVIPFVFFENNFSLNLTLNVFLKCFCMILYNVCASVGLCLNIYTEKTHTVQYSTYCIYFTL